MIILGVDPGISFTGYGIVKSVGNHLSHIESGFIKTDPKLDFSLRLKTIYDTLISVIKEFAPDECSLENIFYCKNVKSALKLGHTRGAIMIAAANQGVKLSEYTPTQIKQAVTGHGGARKEQVHAMVKMILNIKKIDKLDVSDALAAAICHANSSNFKRALKI
jgi:crossover junction endodeoxyribonuclease RuvC